MSVTDIRVSGRWIHLKHCSSIRLVQFDPAARLEPCCNSDTLVRSANEYPSIQLVPYVQGFGRCLSLPFWAVYCMFLLSCIMSVLIPWCSSLLGVPCRVQLAVEMIHEWSQAGTCGYNYDTICKTPTMQRTTLCLSFRWSSAGLHLSRMLITWYDYA